MSEHESNSSDDDERIHEVVKPKKTKANAVYQRAARPTTYDEDEDDEEDEFQRQLRLEQTKQLQDNAAQTKTKVDPDGTVYEWDPTVKGWSVAFSSNFQFHLRFF